MGKRGDKRRKRKQKISKKYLNIDPEYLQYCSNLDDYEYNCLWELYEEEYTWKDYISHWIKLLRKFIRP